MNPIRKKKCLWIGPDSLVQYGSILISSDGYTPEGYRVMDCGLTLISGWGKYDGERKSYRLPSTDEWRFVLLNDDISLKIKY